MVLFLEALIDVPHHEMASDVAPRTDRNDRPLVGAMARRCMDVIGCARELNIDHIGRVSRGLTQLHACTGCCR